MLAPIPNLMPQQIYYCVKDNWHIYAVHTHTHTLILTLSEILSPL